MRISSEGGWFRPQMAGAQFRDRVIAFVGASLAIFATFKICDFLGVGPPGIPALVAPMGASAVMIFVVPASPLSQPLRVFGGHVISAVIGVALIRLIPQPEAAAALAVGASILIMSVLRCLHPPGAATALTAVLGGPWVHAAGLTFALVPVGINALVLVTMGVILHRASGHSYPHRAIESAPVAQAFAPQDIDRALEDLHETFDISRDDLEILLERAEFHARARRLS